MTNPEIYKTANAIGPAIGDAISDGVESFQGIFGIRDGEPGQFTTYTRSGLAYAESPSGAVVEVAQDVPPYEYVDGEKRFMQYAGTNYICYSRDFSEWTITGIASVLGTPLNQIIAGLTATTGSINCVSSGHTADADLNLEIKCSPVDTSGLWRISNPAGVTLGDWDVDLSLISDNTLIYDGHPAVTVLYPFKASGGGVAGQLYRGRVASGKSVKVHWTNLTELTYNLGFEIPTSGTAVTVNAGTTSLLAEDIDTASFLFDSSLNDYVYRDALPEICELCAFTIAISVNMTDISALQTFLTNIKSLTDSFAFSGGSGGSVRVGLYNGSAYTAVKSGTITTGVTKFIITNDGLADLNLYIDNSIQVGTSQPALDRAQLRLSIGARSAGSTPFLTGNSMWDIRFFDRVITEAERTAYQNGESISGAILLPDFSTYREDTFIADLSGNGNTLTSSRNVNLLLSENDDFGYAVNEVARRPWQYTTDDGAVLQKGLKELFLGNADGSLEDSGNLVAINRYKVITTETDHFGAGVVAGDIVTGLTTALDANNTVRQVSPAIGVIPFTAYIPAALTSDMPIIQFEDSDFVALKIEITTGLIKGTDGTNTCVSNAALVADTEYSGWFAWNEDEMWITLEGTKGTIVTFEGYFPDIGNRVFVITDGTYQSIRDLYFKDSIVGFD